MTLTGSTNVEQLDNVRTLYMILFSELALTIAQNLASAVTPLTKAESDLIAELDQKFFRSLVVSQWENCEVIDYWRHMEAGGFKQPTD